MNCAAVRQRLLASERPELPAAEVARHLDGCPACRTLHRRLVALEKQLLCLPVPECPVPSRLLERVRQPGPPVPLLIRRPEAGPGPKPRRETGRQKLALALSLAASLLMFAVGYWVWPAIPPRVRPQAAASRPYLDVRAEVLAEPAVSRRIARLADVAEGLAREAAAAEQRPVRVAELARDFEHLVHDLEDWAGAVPVPAGRDVLTQVAERFRQVESDAARLAVRWKAKNAASSVSVQRIADASRKAEHRLRKLARA